MICFSVTSLLIRVSIVILSLCVGAAIMGPTGAAAASDRSSTSAGPHTNATSVTAFSAKPVLPQNLPNPYAGLPTTFGDEDDVIRLKQSRPSTAAVVQQKIASAAAAGRKTPAFDKINSAEAASKEHGHDEDAYYDEEDEDDEEDDSSHHDDVFDVSDHVGHKTVASGQDYPDESELGPTLDNFGATLDDANGDAPLFLAEPQSTYIVRGRPATLKCKAAHALQVNMRLAINYCNCYSCYRSFGIAALV